MGSKADGRVARPQGWRLINQLGSGGQGLYVAIAHAIAELFKRLWARYAFDLGPVGFLEFVFGVGDSGLELAVVGEQQQPLAIGVETAGDVDPGY